MAVIHDKATETKASVLRAATLAIVDPELTLSSPHVTAMTGSTPSPTPSRRSPQTAATPSPTFSAKHHEPRGGKPEKACLDGANLHCRTQLALASNLAGIAFNDAFLHFATRRRMSSASCSTSRTASPAR